MRLKLENYSHGFRIVSLALTPTVRDHLLAEDLSVLYVNEQDAILFPENVHLSAEDACVQSLRELNSYDVLEIWENGWIQRRYNDESDDNYFFITGGCNSNCIMCPSPDASRKNVPQTNVADLITLAKHIPTDAPHLTITGGEPFLIGEKIFPFLQCLRERFTDTEFLVLTNGRVFAIEKYIQQFVENAPDNTIVAIPIHGSCAQIHDAITRANGSFQQTKRGIQQLLKHNIRVEIRLVVSKLNVNDFDNLANLIIEQFKDIAYVSVIAMEMTGNARVNQELVWMPYKESFAAISGAIRKLVSNGINVKLYNFPICTVEKPFWTLCEKSISSNKVRFAETCDSCKYKAACSGVFAGTFHLERNELKAIL